VANRRFRFLIGTMDYGTILNIAMMANPDFIDIPSDHCIKPNGTKIAYLNIPYDRGVRRLPIKISELWRYSFYG
jgi:hypothetical protein